MTLEEYFQGFGCSPDEVETCVAASEASYRRELREAAKMIARGCILTGDPVERELSQMDEEMVGK